MRLQKYMAACGVASRRKSEEMISRGLVSVNGEKVTQPGLIIDPDNDKVEVSNNVIQLAKKHYYLFNKPSNVLCTAGNPRGRKTVYDFFSDINARLFTVGRLDYKTSGLIIVTNDGEFSNHISHPRYEKEKEYTVRISRFITNEIIDKLEKGVFINEAMTSPAKVSLISRSEKSSAFNIVLREGRNRQVRRMMEKVDCKVIFLQRVRIGKITINGLKEGTYRKLTSKEVEELKK